MGTNVSLGSMTLGYAQDIRFAHKTRFSEVDIPGARGAPSMNMGKTPLRAMLMGELTGSIKESNFTEMERIREIGETLAFDYGSMLKTVVRLLDVSLEAEEPSSLLYALELKESLFKEINRCESTSNVTIGSGSMTVSIEASVIKEGGGCLKVTGTTGTGNNDVKYTPPDNLDLEDFNYPVVLWIRLDNITDLSTLEIRAYTDGSNYAVADVSGIVTAMDTWYRPRIKKSDWSVTGSVDWGDIDHIIVRAVWSSGASRTIYLDDVGAFE